MAHLANQFRKVWNRLDFASEENFKVQYVHGFNYKPVARYYFSLNTCHDVEPRSEDVSVVRGIMFLLLRVFLFLFFLGECISFLARPSFTWVSFGGRIEI